MTPLSERFPYLPIGSGIPSPWLPLRLGDPGSTILVTGLLDTGASVNVLPYSTGAQLGLRWDQQTIPLRLTGNLASLEARAVILAGAVGSFPPRKLAFAWTRSESVPLILGQVNFFLEFDVCFFRSRLLFEVRLHERP